MRTIGPLNAHCWIDLQSHCCAVTEPITVVFCGPSNYIVLVWLSPNVLHALWAVLFDGNFVHSSILFGLSLLYV